MSFKPSLIPTLAFLITLPLLLKLGFWQLDRAEYKRELLATYQQRLTEQPKTLNFIKIKEDVRFLPVKVTGRFINEKSFFVDNQFYKDQVGFHILTPFQTIEGSIILVNRGWVSRGQKRLDLPEITPVCGGITLEGFLSYPDEAILLGENIELNQQKLIVQKIELDDLSDRFGVQLLPYILLINETLPGNYKYDWTPVLPMGPEKHIGYSVTWFGLALTLCVIFIVINVRRREKSNL